MFPFGCKNALAGPPDRAEIRRQRDGEVIARRRVWHSQPDHHIVHDLQPFPAKAARKEVGGYRNDKLVAVVCRTPRAVDVDAETSFLICGNLSDARACAIRRQKVQRDCNAARVCAIRGVDQMRGYVNLGTWSEAEKDAAKAMGQAPGDPKWKDVNKDGKITLDADGQEVIGNATPKFIYGWNNNISYKNFDLTFLIQGSYGNDIFNAVRIKTENPANGLSVNLNNRWTTDNQHTNVPVFLSSRERVLLDLGSNKTTGMGADQRSSRWVEDGSYLRMKNITLTYTLPESLLNSMRVNRLSVYVTATNLFTITKYTGYDPEVSSFNAGGAGGLGIDLSNYPTAKAFMFGINLTF